MPNDPRIIPGWLAKLVSGVLVLVLTAGVPWAISVTNALSVMAVRLEHTQKALEGLPAIEARFDAHIGDPKLHHAGFARIQAQCDALERRLQSLERSKE